MSRQKEIAKRRKQKKQKKSRPLTQVYFCDGPDCLNVMDLSTVKTCPVCNAFHYCCKECQRNDWSKHKKMCGKSADEDGLKMRENYKKALHAGATIYKKVRHGKYETVIYERGNVPASMFATLAEKSNVLNWQSYLEKPLFTTSDMKAFGSLAVKIRAIMDAYPAKKVFVINVIFDRLKKGETTEALVNVYIADDFGMTLDAPDGKLVKKVVKYKRR